MDLTATTTATHMAPIIAIDDTHTMDGEDIMEAEDIMEEGAIMAEGVMAGDIAAKICQFIFGPLCCGIC